MKKMDSIKLEAELLKLINAFIAENQVEISTNVTANTRLIGSSSIFDSIELVTFIVEVEQYLEDEFEIEVQLTTENAMSRRTSPFLSIEAMTKYIIEQNN